MYNPFPFDDPRPVNRPEIRKETTDAIVGGGTPAVVSRLARGIVPSCRQANVVVAFDGYTTAVWEQALNILARECSLAGVEFVSIDQNDACFKSGAEIDAIIDPLLEWDTTVDPTLLFGRIYKGGYEGLLDEGKTAAFEKGLLGLKQGRGRLVAVYGYGCLIPRLR
ncbi:MAG: phosphoheptose isomerase, partial [Candidatus Cryptobacteroides sp.]